MGSGMIDRLLFDRWPIETIGRQDSQPTTKILTWIID